MWHGGVGNAGQPNHQQHQHYKSPRLRGCLITEEFLINKTDKVYCDNKVNLIFHKNYWHGGVDSDWGILGLYHGGWQPGRVGGCAG